MVTPRQGTMYDAVIAYGNFIFRRRNVVFPIMLVGLLLAFAPVLAGGDPLADARLDLVGFLICAAGQLLRFTVVGLEYIKRGGLNKRIYAAKLVTGGMFAVCRNPLYLGNLIILAGLLVIHNNPWVYGLCGAFFLFTYWALVLAEERYLRGEFGAEYDAYCARVPRWLPKLAALPHVFRGMRFSWRRAIAKEYSSCVAWVVSALLVDAYEIVRVEGVAGNWTDLAELGVAFAVASLVLTLVHRLKKSTGFLRDA
jgi:protein-S-isoprenylcysteine O-methyltransferase Ste14